MVVLVVGEKIVDATQVCLVAFDQPLTYGSEIELLKTPVVDSSIGKTTLLL